MATINSQKKRVVLTRVEDASQFIQFDATVSESHTSTATVTDHPVEDGVDLTDHIRRSHDELRITGVVSDLPLPAVEGQFDNPQPANTGGSASPGERATSAYQWLRETKDQGKLLLITTTLRDYKNMVITSIGVTRDSKSSRVVNAEIQLREVLIASTEQGPAPVPAEPKKAPKKDSGRKPNDAETGANKEDGSTLYNLYRRQGTI